MQTPTDPTCGYEVGDLHSLGGVAFEAGVYFKGQRIFIISDLGRGDEIWFDPTPESGDRFRDHKEAMTKCAVALGFDGPNPMDLFTEALIGVADCRMLAKRNRVSVSEALQAHINDIEASGLPLHPATWLHYYNHHRPHTGIGGLTPSARVHNVTGKYT